jgi:hypothetical protein
MSFRNNQLWGRRARLTTAVRITSHIELTLPAQGPADQVPISQIFRVPYLNTRVPFKCRVGDVILVTKISEMGHDKMILREDIEVNFSHPDRKVYTHYQPLAIIKTAIILQ